jgi:hypothetical protein
MNDAYGDPRNFDPNDDQPFDYANFSPTWGERNPYVNPYEGPGIANAPLPTPPPSTTTPPPTTTTGGTKTPQQIEAEGREYDRQHG